MAESFSFHPLLAYSVLTLCTIPFLLSDSATEVASYTGRPCRRNLGAMGICWDSPSFLHGSVIKSGW